jgi:hypothetical protein
VINMSLGSPFGSKDDPSAVATTNAAKDGVVVVTSTGNEGPSPYMAGSPGTADGAISTAANDSWPATPGVLVQTSPAGLALNSINANAYHYTGPITGPLVVLKDNPATTTDQAGFIGSADESLGCSPSAYTFNGVTAAGGQIAVAKRGTCARVSKAIYGQIAGAKAVLMTNNAAGLPPFEGPITSNADTGEPFIVTIPFVGIAGSQTDPNSNSGKLQASPAGSTATLSEIPLPNANFGGFASFSSAGPRTGDSNLKPDVTAPGVSIQSTASGTGNGGTIISGTSMASPHNAGASALVLQAHPTWKPDQIKAAVMNTADPGLATSSATPFLISRGGAGEIQPAKAAKTQVIAFANGGSKFDVAVSFGLAELKNDFKKDGHIKLRNFGSSPATFNVAQAMPQGSPHAIALEKTSVTVPAKGDKDLNFTLTVPAATAGNSDAFREVAGFITFTPAAASDNGGIALRVPYYLVPRAQSNVETTLSDKLAVGKTVTATVANKADAPIAGTGDFYAWGLEDKKDKGKVSNDVRAIGVQSFASATGSNPNRRLLVFAINVHDPWSNAATNEFDIYFDVNNDGVDDYVLVGADQGLVTSGDSNGLLGSFVFSTRSSGAVAVTSGLYTDGSTAFVLALTSSFCRTGEPCLNSATVPGARIAYHAVSFDLLNGGVDEVDGLAKYNPWHEAITSGGFAGPLDPGTSDASNDVSIDAAEWAQTPAKGLMIVTPDNKNGKDEAQLIKVGEKK